MLNTLSIHKKHVFIMFPLRITDASRIKCKGWNRKSISIPKAKINDYRHSGIQSTLPLKPDELGYIIERSRTQFMRPRVAHASLLADLKMESVAIGARWISNGVSNRCTWLRQVTSELNSYYETCTCKMRPLTSWWDWFIYRNAIVDCNYCLLVPGFDMIICLQP